MLLKADNTSTYSPRPCSLWRDVFELIGLFWRLKSTPNIKFNFNPSLMYEKVEYSLEVFTFVNVKVPLFT